MSAATRLGAFLLAFLPGLLFAQAVPATDPVPRVVFPLTTSGNTYTVGPRTADAANAAKFSFGVASNGSVFANTGAQLPTPGGASIPIGVGGRIAKPDVVAALGRFARKTLPVLGVGSALYDLAQELGFNASNDAGPLTFTQVSTSGNYGGFPSVDGFCQSRGFHRGEFVSFSYQSGGTFANVNCFWNANYSGFQVPYTSTQTTTPATTQQFLDAVAAKSDWPTSSALARATVDAIKSGESLSVQPESVTGPASSPGSSSTVTDPVNNTTTVTTTNHNYNYAGATVTVTTTTNTTTTNNATNSVVNNSTTTTSPELPKAQETPSPLCGVPGTPACTVKVDEQGTPEYDANKFKLPESLKTETDAHLETIKGSSDKASMFDNMRSLFSLPPIMECGPINLPSLRGMELGQLNPCAGVEWLRGLMGFVWAAVGFMFCWGCVKEAI